MSSKIGLSLARESEFQRVYEIMHEAFPQNERRTFKGQQELLNKDCYKLYLKKENKQIIAFLAAWEFDEISYIEHFAVDSGYRGNGIGEKMLEEYVSNLEKTVFLEVEPPSTEIAKRRIGFYQGIGFHLNEFDYKQPPLQTGEKPFTLKNMTYPNSLKEEEFSFCKKIIFEKVYEAD